MDERWLMSGRWTSGGLPALASKAISLGIWSLGRSGGGSTPREDTGGVTKTPPTWSLWKPKMDGWFIVQPLATNSTNGWVCTKQLQEQVLHGIIEWAWRQQCRYTGGTGQNDYLPRKQCLVECQEWRSESRKQVYGSSICISIYDLIIYIYYIYNTLDLGVFNLECSTDRILHNWMIWIGASIFCPIRPEIILLDYM